MNDLSVKANTGEELLGTGDYVAPVARGKQPMVEGPATVLLKMEPTTQPEYGGGPRGVSLHTSRYMSAHLPVTPAAL